MENQEESQDIFIEHARRYEQAYHAHVKKYILFNPQPKEPEMTELITWHHWVVAVILIASAVISASHTLPVVLQGNEEMHPAVAFVLAVATFIMIELTAIYFSYAHVVSTSDEYQPHDKRKPLKIGVVSAAGAMFAINIYGVLDQSGKLPTDENFIVFWSWVAIFIYLWVASIPPINAYLCGDILAINVLGLKQENSVALDDYDEAMEQWRTSLENSWNNKKREYGDSIKVSKPMTPTLPHETENSGNKNNSSNSIPIGNNGMETGYGFQRNSSALDKALEHYKNHPEDLKINPIELGERLGIGKSTMYKARSQARKNR